MKKKLLMHYMAFTLLLVPQIARAGEFDHSHELLSKVLKQHVSDSLVDYSSLKANPGDLRNYLNELARVQRTEFAGWNESKRLAFLINLYNATTLHLITKHYPVKSIKDIGSFFKGPWSQPVVQLFGETTTLDHVEHKILRKQYSEPRIHFALVCAARGCPPP